MVQAVKKQVPGFIHDCPYYGRAGGRNIDVNAIISHVLPQVIPTGTYKLVIRLYKPKNTTIGVMEFIADGDAKDVINRMKIG